MSSLTDPTVNELRHALARSDLQALDGDSLNSTQLEAERARSVETRPDIKKPPVLMQFFTHFYCLSASSHLPLRFSCVGQLRWYGCVQESTHGSTGWLLQSCTASLVL